jgi:hypothetical protein
MVNSDFEKIEKEMIADLRFPSTDVLTDTQKINERRTDLQKALSLGNLEHSKIKIYFEDETSRKVVETTVWAVTDKRVILKQSVVIPIGRIHSVSI